MRISTPKPITESLGEWNCYTAEGRTKDERKARLMMAPEQLKDDIKKHVILCFKLRGRK